MKSIKFHNTTKLNKKSRLDCPGELYVKAKFGVMILQPECLTLKDRFPRFFKSQVSSGRTNEKTSDLGLLNRSLGTSVSQQNISMCHLCNSGK